MFEVVEEQPCVLLRCGNLVWALYIMRGLGTLGCIQMLRMSVCTAVSLHRKLLR